MSAPTVTDALSARLRTATADAHARAEAHPFVELCTSGQLSREAWARYLAGLHPIYRALEAGLRRPAAQPLGRFAAPELARTDALARDLASLGWAAEPSNLASEHLDRIATARPEGLLGHAYARYFGDMMGGRVMARAVERSLGPGHSTWLEFDISRPKTYIGELRIAMDTIRFEEDQLLYVVSEAQKAFRDAEDVMTRALTP